MKRSRLLLFFMLFLLSSVLTACTGQALISSWPGVTADENLAYVAAGSHVYGVKVSDGTMAWRYPADKADPNKVFYARPAVTNGQVIVGDYKNVLYSLNAQTGVENWTFKDATDRYVGAALVLNDLILAPNVDHHLYAVNQQGQLQWKFATRDAIWAAPVTDGKNVFVASLDHYLYAVNPSNGSKVWEADLGAAVLYSLAISQDGKTLYAGTLANKLIAVDAATGNLGWQAATKGNIWGRPVETKDGLLVFGDQAGSVYGISAADGSQKWELPVGAPVVASGVLVNDGVVFPMEEGGIQEVKLSGTKGWNSPVNGKLYSSPALSGERLIVPVTSSKDQLLVTVNLAGAQGWKFVEPK